MWSKRLKAIRMRHRRGAVEPMTSAWDVSASDVLTDLTTACRTTGGDAA